MPTMHDRVLSWASDLDEGALEQAQNVAQLPFVHGHVALMPDAHFGYGAPVGAVVATRGAVIPYAVGVDIGCGMIAVRTSLTSRSLPDNLRGLHDRISAHIPAGTGKGHAFGEANREALELHWPWPEPSRGLVVPTLDTKQWQRATHQFGTLGSGNHFIELCLDEEDRVWVVLHSGSRGIGHFLAEQHIKVAKEAYQRAADLYGATLPDDNLAPLAEGTSEFEHYVADMLWAQAYALGNREAMMDSVLDLLSAFLGTHGNGKAFSCDERINTHHNYAQMEYHQGKNVWVTRKGAISARAGELGIVPGSMGTGTFITRGLGNPSSFCSSSHGAGRRLGRKAAHRGLDIKEFRKQMRGKAWNEDQAVALLDEAPGAYKDIGAVMTAQADLSEPVHKLTAVLNYKGAK